MKVAGTSAPQADAPRDDRGRNTDYAIERLKLDAASTKILVVAIPILAVAFLWPLLAYHLLPVTSWAASFFGN
jgi:hypothetical protein